MPSHKRDPTIKLPESVCTTIEIRPQRLLRWYRQLLWNHQISFFSQTMTVVQLQAVKKSMRLDCKVSWSTHNVFHRQISQSSSRAVPRLVGQLYDENVLDEITVICRSRSSATRSLRWCIEGNCAQRRPQLHDRGLIYKAANETGSRLHWRIARLLSAQQANRIARWEHCRIIVRMIITLCLAPSFQESTIANATTHRMAKMDATSYAATTVISAAWRSSSRTVNVNSFGVVMWCAVRARKSEKSTLADDDSPRLLTLLRYLRKHFKMIC